MKDSRGVIQSNYNGQIAVDDKERVIVAASVSQNVTDQAKFKPVVEQVERTLGAWLTRAATMPATHPRKARSGITRAISAIMRQEIPIFVWKVKELKRLAELKKRDRRAVSGGNLSLAARDGDL